jgi:hypothetical protein
MQERYLFEYAVIRIVPRPEREEFINAGVVLYCAERKFLGMRYHVPEARLRALAPELSAAEVSTHLQAFEEVCCGKNPDSPISKLDNASRFRWLTATRSTVVQPSKVHPGLTEDPQATLEKLFVQLVS